MRARRSWRLKRGALAAVASAALAVGGLLATSAEAQTRITVPGASTLYYPNLLTDLPLGRFYLFGTQYASGEPISILEGYDLLNHVLGENWFPDSTPQVVNYPGSMGIVSGSLAAPGVDQAVAMGQVSLDDQIRNAVAGGEHAVIAGLSEGTLVINRELAALTTHPDNAPAPDQLSFVMFGAPETGLFDIYLPVGLRLPIVEYTTHTLAESQYDVTVVFRQYDGWSDPPDRPWNLLADFNAVAGALLFHNGSALAGRPDVVEISRQTSELGGTTTISMIPSPTLPILVPLQQLGVPAAWVDTMNSALKPIVDAGYSRLKPEAGPHFSHGKLVGASRPLTATRVTRATAARRGEAHPTARMSPRTVGRDAS